jgi:FKBP-type peptidyl-prolyl cis-trans isomerase SlyD
MNVTKDRVVTIDYTLTDDEGQVIDSSDGRAPLEYLHGAGNIVAGLEQALEGKSVGEQFQISIAPADAYGERDDDLCQVVSRQEFADVEDLAVGMRFRVTSDAGELVVTVAEVSDEFATLDGNHILAGMTLHFDVTVREVRDASESEVAHGHAHDTG